MAWRSTTRQTHRQTRGLPVATPSVLTRPDQKMPYRHFGHTGLLVSEIGFGAWGIGGESYGSVQRTEALRALARAGDLGCNFVDTARVYGASEDVLGEFLQGRRDRWVVATKHSRSNGPMTASLEHQLRRLRTDFVDLYQLHFLPKQSEQGLYEEIHRLKEQGKTRFVGISLDSADEIDQVIDRVQLDSIQLPFSLLDPDPFLARVERLRASGIAIIIRSTLKEGFLTGKFTRDASFPDPLDQRHEWSREQIAKVVDQISRFRFLEHETGSLLRAAVHYPLSFPEVSTVIMGTKSVAQAESNFDDLPAGRLSTSSLQHIARLQDELGLGSRRDRILRLLRGARRT